MAIEIPLLIAAGALFVVALSRPKKKQGTPDPGTGTGTGTGTECSKEEWINASDLIAMIQNNNPCAFSRPWIVFIRTFEELRYWGSFISGQMLFRAESERPGNSADVAILDKMEAWIKACQWVFASREWLALQDKIESYQIAMHHHADPAVKLSMDSQLWWNVNNANGLNLRSLYAIEQTQSPPGSMPIYEHFKQVLTDYTGRAKPFLFGGSGQIGGKSSGDGYTDEMYPYLMFGNYRWAIGLPQDRYDKLLYAFEPGQWCDGTKDEIWRDADPNGWPGGYIRDPSGHPYYARNCAGTKAGWGEPTAVIGEGEKAILLNEILMPRLFTIAGKTLLYEYAAAHFLQSIYLATINTDAAKENTSAALNIAGKGLALLGGIAGAAASTGVGTVGAAIVGVFAFFASIVQWALSFGANYDREKMARARSANLLRKNLARFGVSVDQFWGWKCRVVRPSSGELKRGGELIYRLNETTGELEVTDPSYEIPFAVTHDPWYYFRIPYTSTGGVAQVPLLALKPDFDFSTFTHYRADSSKVYAIRVSEKYQDIDAKIPKQQYETLWIDLDLKGLKTPKPWGAK